MRKISILSLIAVLAATPMMAKADLAEVSKVGGSIQDNTYVVTPNNDVATTSYVKGAYNATVDLINADREAINSNAGAISGIEGTIGDTTMQTTSQTLTGAIEEVRSSVATLTSNTSADLATTLQSAKDHADSGTATLTNKTIDAGSNTINGLGTGNFGSDAIVDYTDGIASSVNSASDTALVTEKAVVAALATVNGDVEGKQDQLTAGDSNIATTVVQAANVGEVSASGVNSASDTSLVTQKAVLSAALAAENAANTYTDSKRLTVYTTWNSAASSEIALSAATGQ